ncbi:hypothetical protein [Streptomyces paromomycinus]|uniref:Uncharacterized protein n=1 Tax=Streptomyces paromomycinus TaxID=92743 RepID=A0A401VUX3_STREY|nr:hypothetical protein [Streptomyces paromomycinus]GCD40856.1 hypothetical protein GKJPGBOP_00509 [Streptomyces paromomycinus]
MGPLLHRTVRRTGLRHAPHCARPPLTPGPARHINRARRTVIAVPRVGAASNHRTGSAVVR